MNTIFVQITFSVKRQYLDQAKKLIKGFVEEISENESNTLFYQSFQEFDDATKFIHIMAFEDEDAQLSHGKSMYCKTFVEQLYPMCDNIPKQKRLSMFDGIADR